MRGFSRMDAVQSPVIPIVGAMIRETPGTISLGQGVVHYGPPREAIEAVRAALGSPLLDGYGDVAGYRPLVDAIAGKLRRENGIDVDSGRRIMVTAGANMAFMHVVLAITAPDDEVILPAPFYFNHEMAIEMAGCRVVKVPTDTNYQLRLDALEAAITERTRAIVTISPNNPSGAVLTETSLRAVNALCRARGLYHVSDEPYEYFTYGVAHVFARLVRRRRAPHDLDVLAVEGIRVRRLANRLRRVSRGDPRRDDEVSGHHPDQSDDGVAGRGRGSAACGPRVLRTVRARARVDSRHRVLGAEHPRAA
ncbi:MAG: aminotransferase class I/II-fold pyridoxal phosphate-dependent enzyme, partial [Vicinamibacterales bacterium]